MKSWRTSTTGIIAIIVALGNAAQLLIDGNPTTNPDWALTATAIMSGIGLITARDNKVSSEQAGVK